MEKKNYKRISRISCIFVSLLLSIIMSLSFSGICFAETSKGDSFTNAIELSFDKTYTANERDERGYGIDTYFKFTLPTSGRVTVHCSYSGMPTQIYDESGTWSTGSTGYYSDYDKDLTKGTYYLVCNGDYSHHSGDTYTVSVSFESAGESFDEVNNGSNNDLSVASPILLNTEYVGQIASNDSIDVFKFEIPSSGRVTMNVYSLMKSLDIALYGISGETPLLTNDLQMKDITGTISNSISYELTQGTYYLWFDDGDNTGSFKWSISFTDAGESFLEAQGGSNNETKNASPIQTETLYNGHLAINDAADYYSFVAPRSGEYTISFSSTEVENINLSIIYLSGNCAWEKSSDISSITAKNEFEGKAKLEAGTYYLCLGQRETFYSRRTVGEGKYSFRIDLPPISICDASVYNLKDAYKYTGKKIKPSFEVKYKGNKLIKNVDYKVRFSNNKKVGIAKIYITGIGKYTDEGEWEFFIIPKKKTASGKYYFVSSKCKKFYVNYGHMYIKMSGGNISKTGSKSTKSKVMVIPVAKNCKYQEQYVSRYDLKETKKKSNYKKVKNAIKGDFGTSYNYAQSYFEVKKGKVVKVVYCCLSY